MEQRRIDMMRSKLFYLNIVLSLYNLLFGLFVTEKPETLLLIMSFGAIALSLYCTKQQEIAANNERKNAVASYKTALVEIAILLIIMAGNQIAEYINAMFWKSETIGNAIFHIFLIFFWGSIGWFLFKFFKSYYLNHHS